MQILLTAYALYKFQTDSGSLKYTKKQPMNEKYIINQLSKNLRTFSSMLKGIPQDLYLFKQNPEHWCILEIICHLIDEEKEDFRMRLQTVLEAPFKHPPIIDPEGWVKNRNYINQSFKEKLAEFKKERRASVTYLKALDQPKWKNYYEHPSLGPLDGHHFLRNWLAHDYLHVKQITRLKYQYLQSITSSDCRYAGNW